MCFSAPVSFAAGVGLTTMSADALSKATPRERIIALVPLFFGLQQLFEGWQWISLQNSGPNLVAGYGFLFFAFIGWSYYVPLGVYALEKKPRFINKLFAVLGGLMGTYFVNLLLTRPLAISVVNHSIVYSVGTHSNYTWLGILTYVAIICGSLFSSSTPAFRWFGLIMLLSAAFSYAVYTIAFASVWCFFAAALSFLICLYLRRLQARR